MSHMFEHDGITNAQACSEFGYHHGPILNPNQGWLPPRQCLARSNKEPIPSVSTADNADPPKPPMLVLQVNGLVCDVVVSAGPIMCGETFQSQPAFRRHLRCKHPGATANPVTKGASSAERATGENALRLWVRSGGWRDALYAKEPRLIGGLLHAFASKLELIAQSDPAFAHRYGCSFHRPARFFAALPIAPTTSSAYASSHAKHMHRSLSAPTVRTLAGLAADAEAAFKPAQGSVLDHEQPLQITGSRTQATQVPDTDAVLESSSNIVGPAEQCVHQLVETAPCTTSDQICPVRVTTPDAAEPMQQPRSAYASQTPIPVTEGVIAPPDMSWVNDVCRDDYPLDSATPPPAKKARKGIVKAMQAPAEHQIITRKSARQAGTLPRLGRYKV